MQLSTSSLIVCLERSLKEVRLVHEHHRKLIVGSVDGNSFRVNYGRPVEILVVIIVARDGEYFIELDVGNEHCANPVMNQSARCFSRSLIGRGRHNNLSAADLRGALGILECP